MTTLADLKAAGGWRGHIAISIEGYDRLLTDSIDTAGLVTAWAGTPWTLALSGAEISGQVVDEFQPWDDQFHGSSISILVRPDAEDTFAREVFATEKGELTRLADDLNVDPVSSDVEVSSHAKFAASGTVYVGNERIDYASKAATPPRFTSTTRGKFAPFNRDGASDYRFQHEHRIFDDSEHHTERPDVTDAPRSWIGRMVGIYQHTVRGGTWDTKADAHRLYAGRIVGVHDTLEGTRIDLNPILSEIFDRKIFQNGWKASIKEGIELIAGEEIQFTESFNDTSLAGFTINDVMLSVVTGSPADASEIEEGRYSVQELVTHINDALVFHRGNGDLDAYWGIGLYSSDKGGTRCVIRATLPNAPSTYVAPKVQFIAPREVAFMLGYRAESGQKTIGSSQNLTIQAQEFTSTATAELAMVSNETPKRTLAFQSHGYTTLTLSTELQLGVWIDNTELLPPTMVGRRNPASTAQWGIVRIGKRFAFASFAPGSPVSISARSSDSVAQLFGSEVDESWKLNPPSVSIDESGELEIKQVVVIRKPLEYILPRLIGSIRGSGYNHATYDDLPHGLGLGIPWEIVTDTFVDDCERVAVLARWDLQMIIDKPTSLNDLLGAEFVARAAFPVFRDGRVQLTAMRGPVVTGASVALTHDNEMHPPRTPMRAEFEYSDEAIVNAVKLNYNLGPDGEFGSFAIAQNSASISRHGHRSVELNLRSTYGQWVGPVNTIRAVTKMIGKELLPIFARPLVLIRRPISPNLYYQLKPGDVCTLTDSHVRNPATGERGLTAHPAMVRRTVLEPGMGRRSMFAQVELMLWEAGRTKIFSPTGLIDQDADSGGFTDGYNSGTNTIRLKPNEYSDPSEAVDAAGFEIGDEIYVVRIHDESGAATSALVTYQRAITGVSGNDLTLAAPNLGSGGGETAWDGTKLHRVVFEDHDSATTDQQGEHSFQAGTDDLVGASDVDPVLYQRDFSSVATKQASTKLAEAIGSDSSFYYGDEKPVSAGILNQMIRNLDNLLDYQTAHNVPYVVPTGQGATFSSLENFSTDGYSFEFFYPIFVGRGLPGGLKIKLRIAPRVNKNVVADVFSLRCYASAVPASGNDSVGVGTSIRIHQPYSIAEWTVVGSVGWKVLATEDLEIQDAIDKNGVCHLHFGAKRTSGTGNLSMHGLVEARILPVEV